MTCNGTCTKPLAGQGQQKHGTTTHETKKRNDKHETKHMKRQKRKDKTVTKKRNDKMNRKK